MRRQRVEISALALCAALLPSVATAATDRAAIAIFREWGAFREGSAGAPSRCYAFPESPPYRAMAGRGACASVACWPAKRIRTQLAIRLSHPTRDGSAV